MSNITNKTAVELVRSSVIRIQLSNPLYSIFLSGFKKLESTKVEEIGININKINYELIINPEFVKSLKDKELMTYVKKQAIHIMFGHLINFNDLYDKKLKALAIELETSCYYSSQDVIKDSLLTLNKFNEAFNLDFPDRKGTREYYKLLKELSEEQKKDIFDKIDFQGNSDSDEESESDKSFKIMQEWSNESESVDEEGNVTKSSKNLSNLTEFEKSAIDKALKSTLLNLVKNDSKLKGFLPGNIAEELDLFIEPPAVNWRNQLRKNATGSKSYEFKSTKKKESNRYPGTPGKKKLQKGRILFAIDTSGSVSTDELYESLNEMYHISKYGYDVDIIQCDTEIKGKVESIKNHNSLKTFGVKGRGGTNFSPVLEFFNENRKLYNTLIYFTDGGSSDFIPTFNETIWLVSSKGYVSPEMELKNNKVIKITK